MESILPPKQKQKIKKHTSLSLFGISSAEKSFFIENLALLIDSDMGVSYTLETLEGDTKSSRMRKAIQKMRQALNSGDPFWKAIQAPGIFPPRLITLIKTGEDTGTLSDSLKSVNLDMKKEKKFQSKLQSALIYPGIVILVTIVVALIASVTVLPNLTAIFKNSNVPLPLSTRILITFGNVMGAYGVYLVPLILIVLVLVYCILFIWKKTKPIGDFILFHMPIFRTIIQETEVARMGYSSGTLLKAGISIITTFDSLAEGATMLMYKKLYLHIGQRIRQGDSLQKAITSYSKSNKLLPFQVIRILSNAEKSGKLSETFTGIGIHYEEKSDIFAKNIGIIIEPILMIVVGIIVAVVVVSIVAPIYSITSAIS